jgi:hypothetical protein
MDTRKSERLDHFCCKSELEELLPASSKQYIVMIGGRSNATTGRIMLDQSVLVGWVGGAVLSGGVELQQLQWRPV